MLEILNVRKAIEKATGNEVIVDDRTFNPALHRELADAIEEPADSVDTGGEDFLDTE